MNTQNDDRETLQLSKQRAYQTGVIYAKLVALREDMNMGNNKEAITKVNNILKYLETEIIPEFYKNDEQKEQVSV